MHETTWRMFAHAREGTFLNLGSRFYVEMHGFSDPIVEVELREVPEDSPEATHWGWLGNDWRDGWDTEPSMIWPWRQAFSMCFPYGPKAEVEAGRGRVVRLAVRALTEGEDGGHAQQ